MVKNYRVKKVQGYVPPSLPLSLSLFRAPPVILLSRQLAVTAAAAASHLFSSFPKGMIKSKDFVLFPFVTDLPLPYFLNLSHALLVLL